MGCSLSSTKVQALRQAPEGRGGTFADSSLALVQNACKVPVMVPQGEGKMKACGPHTVFQGTEKGGVRFACQVKWKLPDEAKQTIVKCMPRRTAPAT